MNPSVTVVIPTFNGKIWLESSLPEFLAQDYAGQWEILIIDSDSDDGTRALFSAIPNARCHTIRREEFGHGKTRNLALTLSESELLLFTVQDARPMHSQWISNLVSALLESQADAICGSQAVPHHTDKNPLAWYRPLQVTEKVRLVTPRAFQTANPQERTQLCAWDNVNALYRREALRKNPFQDVRFAEDLAWAKSQLETGGSIGYVGHCRVWHYHHHTPQFAWQRTLSLLYWQHHHFGIIPPLPKPPTLTGLLLALKVIIWNSRILAPHRILFWLNYLWTSKAATHRAGQAFAAAYAKGQSDIDELYASMGKQSPLAPKAKA